MTETTHGVPLAFEDKPWSSPTILATIKTEIVRIGNSGRRQDFKFVERIFQEYPELRNA
jgi:hypothetical protein